MKKFYNIIESGKYIYLQAVTIFDLTMGWIEIRTVPLARVDLVSNQLELAPLPSKVIVNRG